MIIVELVMWGMMGMLAALIGCWVYAVLELVFIALGWKEIQL